ncbi:MAG: tetratricopeptide repeat protein [Candidatus Cloacimonetes bacterium]|nr:tetratricopeptide repeat protein [Candidatus Cloacimonadota bacterium]
MIVIFSGCSKQKKQASEENQLPNFDTLWNYQYPDSTEIKFRALIPETKDAGDRDHYLQLLTQIARSQGLQRKYEDAHKTLDEVDSLLTIETITAKIRYLLERGRTFRSSGFPEKAKPLFLEAWNFGIENKLDLYAIDAAHMMGIVEPPEKQLDWSLKALDLTEKTDDKRAKGWLGPLYNNIGWTYFDLKEYEKALQLFQKGQNWREEIKDDNGTRIAKWTIARTYRALGKLDKALEIQLALKKEYEEKQLAQDGYVFEELAELYLLKEQDADAKKYFNLAYEYLSKDPWLAQNEPERLARLKMMSE